MRVFISWSGHASHRLAIALREWLPRVLQSIEPFVSSEDIDKGSRWFSDIGTKLEESHFGILCLTPDNVKAPWILFEAGALSKEVGKARVCPLLADLRPRDLPEPLVNFNAATTEKDDVLKLVKSINAANDKGPIPDALLEKTFRSSWSEFATALHKVQASIREKWQLSDCPVRSRTELPTMDQWLAAQKAKDILIIGQNLNLVMRQESFFRDKLARGGQIRLLIVNPNDEGLIEIMSRGVVEQHYTKLDFQSPLRTIRGLRETLPDNEKSRIDLKTIDYVPSLSFQVLDGHDPRGTILVELAPNRIDVQNRPHFLLHADNEAHEEWYKRFLDNCSKMYDEATPWQWE